MSSEERGVRDTSCALRLPLSHRAAQRKTDGDALDSWDDGHSEHALAAQTNIDTLETRW